jgi:hypothetical protein
MIARTLGPASGEIFLRLTLYKPPKAHDFLVPASRAWKGRSRRQ